MSITRERDDMELRERRFRAADLAALPSELPSGPVCYELENGRLVTTSPPGDEHGAVEAKLVAQLCLQAAKSGLGKVRSGEVGVVLWRNPDRLVGADAVFIAGASLPIRRSPDGYLETIPDLVVEIVSKSDRPARVRGKVADYLAAGVRVVWVADPSQRTFTVYRPGTAEAILDADAVLTEETLLPGFALPVGEAFEE